MKHALDEQLTRKDILWKRKSREMWLENGDRNIKFFHLSTMVRRQRNLIAAIKTDRGEWLKDPVQIEDDFVTNFK